MNKINGSIRRRGNGTWELTLDLGKDANGKRQRKFVNVKGTRAQADQKKRELLTSLDKGIPIGTTKISFGAWPSRWFAEYVIPNTKTKSQEKYESLIRNHIVPSLGEIELAKVTPRDLQGLEARLLAGGMAPKGVECVHNVISGAFKYALRMEMVWRNPAKSVSPPKITRKEVEPPGIAWVKAVLSLAEREDDPFFPCLRLIAYTGIRRGEALGLRHQDLDLDQGSMCVVQTISRSVHMGIIVETTKSSTGRRVV